MAEGVLSEGGLLAGLQRPRVVALVQPTGEPRRPDFGASARRIGVFRLVPLHGFICAPRSWATLAQTSYLPATLYVYRRVGVAFELGTTVWHSQLLSVTFSLLVDERADVARLRRVRGGDVLQRDSCHLAL